MLENNQNLLLCVDIMYIKKIPFLLTVSKKLRFITSEVTKDRNIKTIIKVAKKV